MALKQLLQRADELVCGVCGHPAADHQVAVGSCARSHGANLRGRGGGGLVRSLCEWGVCGGGSVGRGGLIRCSLTAEGRVGEGEIGRHGDAGTRGRAESEKRIAETKRSEVPPRRVNCSRRSEVSMQTKARRHQGKEDAQVRGRSRTSICNLTYGTDKGAHDRCASSGVGYFPDSSRGIRLSKNVAQCGQEG